MELAVIVVVVVAALAFDYTNGFHDAANAIATSVATRALAPRTALIMAAVMNLIGAFLGTEVATTVGSGIIDAPQGLAGLVVVLAAILVPQGMAYAELAGLPPVTGLYTTIACLVGYAIMGPSRILVLGPDSSLGPLIFAAITPLVARSTSPSSISPLDRCPSASFSTSTPSG